MTSDRKKQIAWWAAKVRDQATMYADVVDPERKRQNRIANKLDAIHRLARDIQAELTQEAFGDR
jgi:hypothetical protein